MKVAIIKYNAGNIHSVRLALNRLGIEPEVSDDPEILRSADKVIFPGVGEAGTTMAYLRQRGLDEVIRGLRQPFLGICLGLQLMCRHSEENDTPCLALFDIA
ncbi:MAG TPA: imidazole glycerol phosphate synthase subunit HisH, partial [bacterium]|nr:imidazole glycerol phosphate synthase subunit HisH [bacterium]